MLAHGSGHFFGKPKCRAKGPKSDRSPLVRWMADGVEHSLAESVDAMTLEFALTYDEKRQTIPSGTKTTIEDRVGWART